MCVCESVWGLSLNSSLGFYNKSDLFKCIIFICTSVCLSHIITCLFFFLVSINKLWIINLLVVLFYLHSMTWFTCRVGYRWSQYGGIPAFCMFSFLCICLYAGTQANSSEFLRQYGLSLLHSHIVLLTRTRACQLEAPPKPPPVPQWKLIRPRKEIHVTDEPQSAWETEKDSGNKKAHVKIEFGRKRWWGGHQEEDAGEDIKHIEKHKLCDGV